MFDKKAHDKAYYQQNKAKYQDYDKQRRVALKLKLLDYLKFNPCVDCPEIDPVVLEFHHVADKCHEIMRMVCACYAWARIEAELKKCIVLCANCHRRRTYKQFGYRK